MSNSNLGVDFAPRSPDLAQAPKYRSRDRLAFEIQNEFGRARAAPGSRQPKTGRWSVGQTLLFSGAASLALWGLVAGAIFAITR